MGSSQCSSSASPPPNPFPSSPLHILPPSIDPVPISDPQRPQFWCRNQTPEVVVDEGLAGNDAEEVNQALGGVSDVGAYGVAAGGGVEDGKVDVGVRVFEETPVLMPALPGANGAQDGD
nr:hypothetical protein PanWU01x14_097090 [Ipomoea batatas]